MSSCRLSDGSKLNLIKLPHSMFKTKPHSAFARVLALLTAITVALPPMLPLTASPAMEKLF